MGGRKEPVTAGEPVVEAVPKRVLEQLSAARVLCFGDLMLDQYVHGEVERVSPEGPIPVLRVRECLESLGGVGTVVRNLAALGCTVELLAPVGDDRHADRLRLLLEELPGVTANLITSRRPTTVKRRYVANGQQILRADTEECYPLAGDIAASIIARAEQMLAANAAADVVVISDYRKGAATNEVVRRIIDAARQRGQEVIVDPKGDDYGRYRGAHWVTPNRRELHQATRLAVETNEDVAAAAIRLSHQCGIDTVLATRSAEGLSMIRGGTTDPIVKHIPAQAREVFDVSGAGDTVVAWLAAARGAGVAHEMAARLANTAAGIAVGKAGAAVVYVGEMERALLGSGGLSKVRSRDELLSAVGEWRKRGLTIGLTNGCFDLIHPGHVALIQQAKGQCDRLVIAVNSDASVRRLKGSTRPVQNEKARAVVLAAFEAVDAIIIFSEDTPASLIDAVVPDVLIKGADWRREDVVGAATVEAHGGRVVLVPLIEGHSTTRMEALLGPRRMLP